MDLAQPIAGASNPQFDGILAYCMMCERFGSPTDFPKKADFDVVASMPLNRENGYFFASQMLYDKSLTHESSEHLRRAWEVTYEHIVSPKGSIDKQRGFYRSQDVAFQIRAIPKVWFYIDTDNVDRVGELLGYLQGIGKLTNKGWGDIANIQILPTEEVSFSTHLLRATPVEYVTEMQIANTRELGYTVFKKAQAILPPYAFRPQYVCWGLM